MRKITTFLSIMQQFDRKSEFFVHFVKYILQ